MVFYMKGMIMLQQLSSTGHQLYEMVAKINNEHLKIMISMNFKRKEVLFNVPIV